MSTLGWRWEYEPEVPGMFRIFDFVLTDWQWPIIVEAKPALSLDEFASYRQLLQNEARGWIMDELNQRRKFFDELPIETVSLDEYDAVLADIARVERGEDAIDGRRAVIGGSTLHNDPVRDGVTLDGQHYVLQCRGDDTGLGRIGERCLRCGDTGHAPVRASTVLGAWLAAGDASQWLPNKPVIR